MKCLRCGYCCNKYLVVVVDNPDLGISPNNLIVSKGNKPCKHLEGKNSGEYSCAIHNKDWYKETPCFLFGQIEKSEEEPCRLGVAVMEGKISI